MCDPMGCFASKKTSGQEALRLPALHSLFRFILDKADHPGRYPPSSAYLLRTGMVLGTVRLSGSIAVVLQIGLSTRAAGPQLFGAASAAHNKDKCADHH
jgi:hypothetical protein